MRPQLLLARRFQVPDLDRDMRFAADADGFVDARRMIGVAFAAHVRGVDAAELGGFGGKRDQLFRGGVRRGRILQRGGDAHRAIAHGFAHQLLSSVRVRPAVGARSSSPITTRRTCVAPT